MAWKSISDRKWELKNKGVVIATIYQKTSDRYSLFVATPMVYQKVASLLGKTYVFDSLEQAQAECDKKLLKQVLPWCESIVSWCKREDTSEETDLDSVQNPNDEV